MSADITPKKADFRAELATTATDETLDPAFTPSITPRQNSSKRNLKKGARRRGEGRREVACATKRAAHVSERKRPYEWSGGGSNSRPLHCECASTPSQVIVAMHLPAAFRRLYQCLYQRRRKRKRRRSRSGSGQRKRRDRPGPGIIYHQPDRPAGKARRRPSDSLTGRPRTAGLDAQRKPGEPTG